MESNISQKLLSEDSGLHSETSEANIVPALNQSQLEFEHHSQRAQSYEQLGSRTDSLPMTPRSRQAMLFQTKYSQQRAALLQEQKKEMKVQLKLKLSQLDKMVILCFNLLEPVLIALIVGSAMQLAQLGTAIYLLITVACLSPFILTENPQIIKVKKWLTFTMLLVSIFIISMKTWIYCQFTTTSNVNANQYLQYFLGVWPDQWTKTFLVDLFVFAVSLPLTFYYIYQIDQAESRLLKQGTLKFQTQIKLLHFEFGKKARLLFWVVYGLFSIDTLVDQTFVQFAVLLILVCFLHVWATAQELSRLLTEKLLRIIQVTSYVFIVISFILRLPTVFNTWEFDHQRLLQVFGLEALVFNTQKDYTWLSRCHRYILAFAVTLTQAYFVANALIDQKNYNNEELQPQQDINAKPQSLKPEIKKQKSSIWSYCRLPALLWICRLLCLIQAYRYHDWQSLVPLIWIMHSSLFVNRKKFVHLTIWIHLPLMYLCYLWYFTVNIFGLVDYDQIKAQGKTNMMYLYGFYQFKNPELELPICLSSILAIAWYCRLNLQNKTPKRNFMAYLLKHKPTINAACYLYLNNISVLVFIYCVVFSLLIMNLLHIMVLVIMIVAQFQPQLYHRNIRWLVFYAYFFMLSKYIYTLCVQSTQAKVANIVFGFWEQSYDPNGLNEYWRYRIPIPIWVFILLATMQFRANQILGNNFSVILAESEAAGERIALKQPWLKKVYQGFMIVLNHSITLLTFLFFLLAIYFIRRTFINGGSLVLVLVLLGFYLNRGIATMLKYWRILQLYQAVVLLLMLLVQFFYNIAISEIAQQHSSRLQSIWASLNDNQQAFWHYVGFYTFETPIWKSFLPYVFLFFFSIIVEPRFRLKLAMESQELNVAESMQYRTSYLLWKCQWAWPVFTFVAVRFNYVILTFILYCALYYSIALIWLVWLSIFMFQTWFVQRKHMKYQKAQVIRFANLACPEGLVRETMNASEKRYQSLLQKVKDTKPSIDLQKEIDSAYNHIAGPVRMCITDEEAVREVIKYESEIDLVTLEAREFFWTFQFGMLVFANIMIYISVFISTPTTPSNPATLVPQEYQSQTLFLFFFAGFYQLTSIGNLVSSSDNFEYWPFFTLLILLIVEKWCQSWIKNKFETNPVIIEQFKKMTQQASSSESMHSLQSSHSSSQSSEEQIESELFSESLDSDLTRATFNPLHPIVAQERKKVYDQLYPLLTVKYSLKSSFACKVLIQEVAIMLVFTSLIYKQNIFSFVLYIVLVYYTVQKFRKKNPMLLVRYTVVVIILIEYLFALTNLSSYNSPTPIPQTLTIYQNQTSVYPNPSQYYFNIPWEFRVTRQQNQTLLVPQISIAVFEFFGVSVGPRQLNGLWLDYSVVILMFVYLNNYSIWIIKKEFKIVRSKKTESLLLQYAKLQQRKDLIDLKSVARELMDERSRIRFFKWAAEAIYTNFALVMILFIMLTSVFSHNLIALGYFIFSMVLIFNYRNFFKQSSARDNQIIILKYFLLPYLLIDILLQLCTQIPFDKTQFFINFMQVVGFVEVWSYVPPTLYLGQNLGTGVQVLEQVSSSTSLTILFLKAVVYFVVSMQLSTILSLSFMKFYDSVLFENLTDTELIGQGLAYRFNNFKNRKLKKQSNNYAHLDYMLKHVKQILKRKEGKVANEPAQIQLEDSTDYKQQFQQDIRIAYEKRVRDLNFMFKLYLWIKRNFVLDILFKHSHDHLVDIVNQFREGRTAIRTQIELGLMIETKQLWLEQKQQHYQTLRNLNEITEEQWKDWRSFRQQVLDSLTLKPWERYNADTFLSYKSLFKYFIILLLKAITSNLHILCYFFMILCVIMNGGALYMVYPALVFGLAIVEEERPGKKFWYFVIFYTQLLIMLQYVAQLGVWSDSAGSTQYGERFLTWSKNHNIGINQVNSDNTYSQLFWFIFPELALLMSVLVHIQNETMAGIFDFSFQSYESFTDGLKREEQNLLANDKQFKKQHQKQAIETRQLLKGLDFIVPTKKTPSAQDAYEAPQNIIEPIDLNQTGYSLEVSQLFMPVTLDEELLKYPLRKEPQKLRSLSFDVQSSERLVIKLSLFTSAKKEVLQVTNKLWDNSFFDRLFPKIKQQKPGRDLYVGIALSSILIILYLIVLFPQMGGQSSSISQQFSNNQFSGAMVLSMLIMICIMITDRYFYSSQSFLSRRFVEKKLGTDVPITESSDPPSEVDMSPFQEEEPVTFQDWLIPQYVPQGPMRVMRLYFLWLVLGAVHYYIFFWLTDERSVCASVPYCNKFSSNSYLVCFYLLFCLYFYFVAAQIKYGLPELKKGGFMLGRFDPVSKLTYYSWYYTPFLFELRTIIDWTFTSTSLDVFQSISLAQIQSDLYIAKCYNKPYMEKPLGEKISLVLKIVVGFSLMLFIIALIAGPMLLFSSINPVGQANPVSSGDLSFYITINDPNQGTTLSVNLFATSQLTKNQTLTQTQFNDMQFNNPVSSSDQFSASQTQALQFSPISDDIWGITQPKKQLLLAALVNIRNDPNTNNTVVGNLEARFMRDSATSVTAYYDTYFPLTNANQTVLTQLIDAINCTGISNEVKFPYSVNAAISLNQNSKAFQLNQQEPSICGFNLIFACDASNQAQDYWSLQQNFTNTSTLYQTETQIFPNVTGFGLFVMNQEVLPNFLSSYASSVIFFYVAIVYVIASTFRSAFVPFTSQIFIIDAPFTEDLLMICQVIYIYRVQRNLKNEMELYHILLEIMRSPETIKSLAGSSLKRILD